MPWPRTLQVAVNPNFGCHESNQDKLIHQKHVIWTTKKPSNLPQTKTLRDESPHCFQDSEAISVQMLRCPRVLLNPESLVVCVGNDLPRFTLMPYFHVSNTWHSRPAWIGSKLLPYFAHGWDMSHPLLPLSVTLQRSITTAWPLCKACRATFMQACREPKVSWFTTHHLEPRSRKLHENRQTWTSSS